MFLRLDYCFNNLTPRRHSNTLANDNDPLDIPRYYLLMLPNVLCDRDRMTERL